MSCRPQQCDPEAVGACGSSNYFPAEAGHPSAGQPTTAMQTSPPNMTGDMGLSSWIQSLAVLNGIAFKGMNTEPWP